MNYKLIPRNEILPDEALTARLSAKMQLHPVLVRLLLSRGLEGEEQILRYLNPDEKNFYDPFLMKGMAEAVERINRAIENGEKVVVYGDYDADGICAAAILSLYLSSRGLDVYTHIPNRSGDGYGLNVESVERIIENCCPDLILTCDCGISGHDEVEYAMDLGVDVIVTDHHEVDRTVPECIVVNPKQPDCRYPYSYLCGAGVAVKLVHALGGLEAAAQYLDLAALATVADLVPLLDENRLIVQLGLKKMCEKKNLGLKTLFADQKIAYPPTSGDIAYKIAPRINAAGRMGDAYRAFELVTSSNSARVREIVNEIESDNLRRKKRCDELYEEAVSDLQYEDLAHERAIVLSNPEWEKGITGILAARLSGDFKRPAFVLVNSGEQYKGTSRSIPGINIYELLQSLSDILIEFGGHSQAAGFSIARENIPVFKSRVNEALNALPESLFGPTLEYDLQVEESALDANLARALEAIEPSGNGNTRPLFRTTVARLGVAPCKTNYNHTSITTETGLQVLAFNFYAQNQFLTGEGGKDLILELQLNSYLNRENAKGILRGVSPERLFVNDSVAKANFLKTLGYLSSAGAEAEPYGPDELDALVGNNLYGTLVVAGRKESYDRFRQTTDKPWLINEFLYSTGKNNYSRIMVSPDFDENLLLANYERIVFLDTPPALAAVSFLNKRTKARVYVPKESDEEVFYDGLDLSRAEFGRYFDAIRRNSDLQSTNILSYYKLLAARMPDCKISQLIACFLVFAQLKLMGVEGGSFAPKVNRDVKKELTDSSIYRYLTEKTEKKA